MNRRKFVRAAGVSAIGSAVLAAPAIAQSQPVLKWRLTSSFPKTLDTIFAVAETFSRTVSEATDGNFHIQVFPANEIVPGLQAADAVTNGSVEMCQTSSYYYVGKDPTFAFGTAVPFGINARQQNAWLYFGGGMELITTSMQSTRSTRCRAAIPARRWAAGSASEIKSLADLNGLKMRIGGLRRPGRLRSSAWCRSRSPAAKSIRRSRRAPSMPPNGSAPMTMRSSASTRWRPITTIPAGGRVAPTSISSSISRNGTRCLRVIRRILTSAAAGRQYRDAGAAMTRSIRRRSRTWSPAARGCGPSPPDVHGSLPQGGQGALCRDRRRTPIQEDAMILMWRSGTQISLVPGCGIFLRQFHDAHAAAEEGL